MCIHILIIEGKLDAKLLTKWTDENQRWEESEKRRQKKTKEEKRREETRHGETRREEKRKESEEDAGAREGDKPQFSAFF